MIEDPGFWPRLILAALATWRLTHLLAAEDGLFDAVAHLRARLGRAGRVLDCFYCLSLWVAAPMALFVSTRPSIWWCVWLALSAAACLINRVAEPTVIMQQLRGEDDGMLWTEPGRDVENEREHEHEREHERTGPSDQPDAGGSGTQTQPHAGGSRAHPGIARPAAAFIPANPADGQN